MLERRPLGLVLLMPEALQGGWPLGTGQCPLPWCPTCSKEELGRSGNAEGARTGSRAQWSVGVLGKRIWSVWAGLMPVLQAKLRFYKAITFGKTVVGSFKSLRRPWRPVVRFLAALRPCGGCPFKRPRIPQCPINACGKCVLCSPLPQAGVRVGTRGEGPPALGTAVTLPSLFQRAQSR